MTCFRTDDQGWGSGEFMQSLQDWRWPPAMTQGHPTSKSSTQVKHLVISAAWPAPDEWSPSGSASAQMSTGRLSLLRRPLCGVVQHRTEIAGKDLSRWSGSLASDNAMTEISSWRATIISFGWNANRHGVATIARRWSPSRELHIGRQSVRLLKTVWNEFAEPGYPLRSSSTS